MPVYPAEGKEKTSSASKVVITSSEKSCYNNEKISRITVEELSERVKDFVKGDPLFYTLLSVFSGANRDTCYYVEGKDLQKIFLNKAILDFTDLEVRDNRTLYKTRAPVNEIKWVSASISEGNIKVSSRLRNRFVKTVLGSKVLGIPRTLDFTIYTSASDTGKALKNKDEYKVFIAYENSEEPFVSDLVTFLTGLTSHEMHVKKNDKKANRREAYKTLHYLHDNGLINIY